MNDYKLIIADYDGTLAGSDFIVSEKTSSAIKQWIEGGNMFSIASGRQYLMLKKDCEMLGIDTPIIVRGGAEIVNPKTGEVLFAEHMSQEVVKEVVEVLKTHTDKIAIEKDNTIYSTFHFRGDFPEIQRKTLEEFNISSAPKIMAKADIDHLQVLESAMSELSDRFPSLNFVRSYTPLGSGWDITSIKGTKHLAVLELIKMLGVSPEQTVGVGDGYNDFSLLEACGLKVAMENANEELKAIADLVIPSEEEDGVAILIHKLLAEK